ncbi:hypothetical protein AVEN_165033-1 [Araneus ventricosus]|uniref:RNase H type-1 domain-containing protein n=1 Tax=Araneus ventricosus TaxID=182803 RepID=A0A4Y2GJP6_ARAVE|nr:hypothetical protein AVEN_165033-1 [Araneus ventricosus]
MPFTKEERIYINLLAGSGTNRHVARTFNTTNRRQITHDTVAKLTVKFKTTCSIANAIRSGRPKTAIHEDVPIELRTLDIFPKGLNNQYEVYTDGSRIGDDTGFSVCILKNGELFKIFQFKLNRNNTVFQTEVAAINFAVCWALENGVRINIHTDSQSSIKALQSARSRSATVNKVKNFFIWLRGRWDSPGSKHKAGEPGNELTDHHAKLTTAVEEKLEIPTPYSCESLKLKRIC